MSQGTGAIIYYSRTGATCAAAQRLARRSGACLVALALKRYRQGPAGRLRARLDTLFSVAPPLDDALPDLGARPWVAIGGPLWLGQPAPPLRRVLTEAALPRRVGLFLTADRPGAPNRAYTDCADTLGRPLAARTWLRPGPDHEEETARRLDLFHDTLARSPARTPPEPALRLV